MKISTHFNILIGSLIAVAALNMCCLFYLIGKHSADKYYERQGCVTLIAPTKYRVPAPQAQIEQPKENQQ